MTKSLAKKILILAPTLSRAKEMAKERLGRNDVEVDIVPKGKSYLYIVPRNYI